MSTPKADDMSDLKKDVLRRKELKRSKQLNIKADAVKSLKKNNWSELKAHLHEAYSGLSEYSNLGIAGDNYVSSLPDNVDANTSKDMLSQYRKDIQHYKNMLDILRPKVHAYPDEIVSLDDFPVFLDLMQELNTLASDMIRVLTPTSLDIIQMTHSDRTAENNNG